MCAGPQLLLLPRCGGRLPSGLSAECPQCHAQQAAAVYCGAADADGACSGPADLRLPVPLRTYPGAAPQDPREKDQKRPVEPETVLAEVCGAGCVRGGDSPVVRLHLRLSPARLLQIYLPCRHPGGRHSPGGHAGGVPVPGRVALHLEDGPVRRHPAAVRILLPGLLPLFVPPGGHLLPLQPGGLPGRRGQVRRLRPVYPHVRNGCGARGRPGVHPVRPVPPYLPQRGHLFWLGKEQTNP